MIEIDKLVPLLELLQRARVSHIKMDDLELSFLEPLPPAPTAPEVPAPSHEPIQHKDEGLSNVMKLSDAELIDTLFPLPQAPEGNSA